MFKCPVCHHATLNVWQYGFKSGISTVQCSNCHAKLHQPMKLRNGLAALPLLLLLLPHRLGWPESHFLDVLWLSVCALLAFALALWLTRIEPVAPTAKTQPQ